MTTILGLCQHCGRLRRIKFCADAGEKGRWLCKECAAPMKTEK